MLPSHTHLLRIIHLPLQLSQGTRWGSPEHLPSHCFSPGASLNVGFHKNQPDLVVNISGKFPGDLVPKFQLCAGPQADPWRVGGSWSCPLMNTTLLAPHFICHYSPYVCKLPLSCQLAALQGSFKKKKIIYWLFLLRLSQKNYMDVSQDFQELFTGLMLF